MHSKGSAETSAGIPLQKVPSLIQLFLVSVYIYGSMMKMKQSRVLYISVTEV